jgi:hypothetical protein
VVQQSLSVAGCEPLKIDAFALHAIDWYWIRRRATELAASLRDFVSVDGEDDCWRVHSHLLLDIPHALKHLQNRRTLLCNRLVINRFIATE